MNFKNWTVANEKAEELNLYTKTNLKENYNRKPIKDAKEIICRVYTGGRWKDFSFYRMEDTVEIKRRESKEIIELEITDDNIFKSLYVINKSAKKSRDNKIKNYDLERYGIVSRCKERENKLYKLKNRVMEKAILENKLKLEGFHVQSISNRCVYLCLYKGGEYSFHIPVEEKPDGKFLGKLDNKISSEVKVTTKIKFKQAVDLLERYIDEIE